MKILKTALARVLIASLVLLHPIINIAYAGNPEAQAYYEKGRVLLYSGDEGFGPHILEAITAFETAIRIDPDLVSAYLLLSDAYKKRRIPLKRKSATWKELKQKSNDLIKEAVKIAPDNTEALIYFSSLIKDRDESLKIYRKIVELEPDHPEAHESLARLLDLIGRKDEAIQELLLQVQINDKDNSGIINTRIFLKLWKLLTEEDRKDEAIALMKQFLEGPYPPQAVSNFLIRSIDTSAYTEKKYQHIVKKTNQYKNHHNKEYYQKARDALEMGQLAEAMDAFAQHVEVNPYNIWLYEEFARLLASGGHYKEAYRIYEALLDIDLVSPPQKCSGLGGLRLRVDFIGPDRSLPKKLVKVCGHKVVLIP